jgi:WD40 repeat protein/serine/threonine protein kinase
MTMLADSMDVSDREQRLSAVVLSCLEALDRGRTLDRQELLARYPEFAAELSKFLADHVQVDRRAAPLRIVSQHLAAAEADAALALAAGTPLGDFRLIRQVGRGGMGVVYEAEQLSLGRRVALKVLPFATTMDPRQLQRFQNEARAAASLEHPHIVPVYGVGCERGVHYYAMKFIDGQSLAGVIQRQRANSASGGRQPPDGIQDRGADATRSPDTVPSPVARTERAPREAAAFRQIAEWGIQAAEALEHAHSVGIVHRDIKPANLMIDSHGALWVTDFGLARTAADAGLTMTGDVLGTLRYMSPEQALAKHGLVDHRTDVYSLGVTLYELLTGTPAVGGEDREQILNAITLDEPRPPRSVDAAIPRDLETIVLKAMAKNPEERYATALELADDLESFREHRPIRARGPTPWQRVRRWAGRHWVVVTATATVVVIAIVLLAVSSVFVLQATDEALRQRDLAREQETRAQEQAVIARAQLYVADIAQAHQACQRGDSKRARDLLARHIPHAGEEEQRGFEWHYLARLAGKELRDSRLPVYHVAFSPDGRRLAAACSDGLFLWNATTGQSEASFAGHVGEVNCVCFAPDGRQLASAGDDGSVRLWDVASRSQLHAFTHAHEGEASAVGFASDGRTLVSGGQDGVLRLWDMRMRSRVAELRGHTGLIEALTVSPDGRTVASASRDCTVRVWDLATRQSVTLVHDRSVTGVAFAPHRPLLAVACSLGPSTLWDLVSFQKVKTLVPYTATESIAFLDDDSVAIGNWEGGITIWNWERGETLRPHKLHGQRVYSLAYSSPLGLLASAGREGRIELRPWPPLQGEKLGPAHLAGIGAPCYSPDGSMLAVARADGRVLFLDAATGVSVYEIRPQEPVVSLAFDPKGALLCMETEPGGAEIWDFRLRSRLLAVPGDRSGATAIGFGPWGPMAAVPRRGTTEFWQLPFGQGPRSTRQRIPGTYGVAFSPCGTLLATGEPYGLLQLRDVASGGVQLSIHTAVDCHGWLRFTPDGRLLITFAGDCGELRSWDTATGAPGALSCDQRIALFPIAISPDGRTFVSAERFGQRAHLWNARTGQELFALTLPREEGFAGVAFAPDNRTLAACAWENSEKAHVYVWRGRDPSGGWDGEP